MRNSRRWSEGSNEVFDEQCMLGVYKQHLCTSYSIIHASRAVLYPRSSSYTAQWWSECTMLTSSIQQQHAQLLIDAHSHTTSFPAHRSPSSILDVRHLAQLRSRRPPSMQFKSACGFFLCRLWISIIRISFPSGYLIAQVLSRLV